MSKRKRIIVWAALGLITGAIFLFSAQTADQSADLSRSVLREILKKLIPNYEALDAAEQRQMILLYHHLIRKGAHFMVYLLWGGLLSALVYLYGLSRAKQALIVLSAGFVYACSDEFHQLFIPGRGAQWSDVFLDFSGVAAGLAVFWIISCFFAKHKNKVKLKK